ncbi:hypothetical protein AVEN_207329-1 [Araneus ventricosus]|uniref:Endonuclease/exonuclease/phosphatase domain-containing protein n=1 Tax=Araneus ventricosus TaxID=182803 RepID=A0A4Y2VCT6_ARAVE|nr:hypothetical protein AVEN_46693-1 [Araneus ventricosus]GBO22398.1 hypothetical protein AVEN_61917-1 [Araneus ventricosus]GBO22401.1 hypothetical protein AVEN_109539-1 [Araneus ventricosus]GBO22404.1 hypothetical protein AVEN_207329-1 [Araneus ventricosus]
MFVNEHNPDVILLQETHLRPNQKIYLANYYSYYSYRKNQSPLHASGGTAVLIKNNIPHNELNLPNLAAAEASATTINIKNKDPHHSHLKLRPPPSSQASFLTFDIENLIQISTNQIICGDCNAHHISWGCNNCNHAGDALYAFANNAGIEILSPPTPTRYGVNSATTIDLAIVKSFLMKFTLSLSSARIITRFC